MQLDWEKLVKRYVWHDEKTPYFTRVRNLTPVQAGYELLAYSLFTGIFFAVLAVASFSQKLPHGTARVVALYAFTVACAAVLLGTLRHPWAAMYCAASPLGMLAYFGVFGFPDGLAGMDHALLAGIMAVWFAYSLRVVAVARTCRRA